MSQNGTLLVKPLHGKLKRDTETFAKMDPYVELILGNKSKNQNF